MLLDHFFKRLYRRWFKSLRATGKQSHHRPTFDYLEDRLVPSGRSLYVSPTGNDLNDGSLTAPWKTISAAATHLIAGDTLYVRGGTYYERPTVAVSGTATAPITIQAFPGETPILDSGVADFRTPGNSDWVLDNAALGIYKSAKTYTGLGYLYGYMPVANYINGSVGLVPYQSQTAFSSASEQYVNSSTMFYVGPGTYFGTDGRIYIRLAKTAELRYDETRDGQVFDTDLPDPRNYSIDISGAGTTLTVTGSYLHFDGLEVHQAQRAILVQPNSHDLVFQNLTVWCGDRGIEINGGHHVLITQSRVYGDVPRWISWSDSKSAPAPADLFRGTNINTKGGAHDIEISYTHVRGGHDLIGMDDNEYNVTIHHNRIENGQDDAIEIEGTVNVGRHDIYENYIANCLVALSEGQDTEKFDGPGFFYRNVVSLLHNPFINRKDGINAWNGGGRYGFEYMFKMAGSTGYTTKNVHVYQNTLVMLNTAGDGMHLMEQDPTNARIANNLLVMINGEVDDSYRNATGLVRDGNLYWKVNTVDTEHLVAGYDTVAAFTAATGQESHGLGSVPRRGTDPRFSTLALPILDKTKTLWELPATSEVFTPADFLLSALSPAIGAGIDIPPLAGFGVLPDSRNSRDIGAFPYGTLPSELNVWPLNLLAGTGPANQSPTLDALGPLVVNEDGPTRTVGLAGISAGPSDEASQTVTVTATSSHPTIIPNPVVSYFSPNATGLLTFTPLANANTAASGPVTITVNVRDGQALNGVTSRSFTVTITAVNDPPLLDQPGNSAFNEDAPPVSITLTGIAAGPANEISQNVVVTATSSNTALVPNPSVNYSSPNGTGLLTFTPRTDANGAATISVTVNDGQGLSNSVTRSFLVSIAPDNDAPTLDPLNNLALREDDGTQVVALGGISAGPDNEVQPLTVSVLSSNTSLIPNPILIYAASGSTGSLTFAPLPQANGTATITVIVNDGQGLHNTVTRDFTVTVSPANDPPTLDQPPTWNCNEDAPAQTVALTGISAGPPNESPNVVVTAVSNNTALIANPVVIYSGTGVSGTLVFTPQPNANGSASISITVNDGQGLNNIITRTLAVTVTAVNDPPTLDQPNTIRLNEDAPSQTLTLTGISAGPEDEASQQLTLTASSSNTLLIPTPAVTYSSSTGTGVLVISPTPDANGLATIVVTVNDGQGINHTVARSFPVIITAVNDAPLLDPIADVFLNEDAPTRSVALTGIKAGPSNENQPLTVAAVSSNTALIANPTIVFTSPATTATLVFTPVADTYGSATISVVVNDGQGINNTVTHEFVVVVAPINDPPTLNALSPVSIPKNAPAQVVFLSGITAGPTNEGQGLVVTATSNNPTLIPNPAVTYTSPTSTGRLTFLPAQNQAGSATITVTVNDGQGIDNLVTRLFTVIVSA